MFISKTGKEQCCCISRCIGLVTPAIVYFYFTINNISGIKIPHNHLDILILNTKALAGNAQVPGLGPRQSQVTPKITYFHNLSNRIFLDFLESSENCFNILISKTKTPTGNAQVGAFRPGLGPEYSQLFDREVVRDEELRKCFLSVELRERAFQHVLYFEVANPEQRHDHAVLQSELRLQFSRLPHQHLLQHRLLRQILHGGKRRLS